MKRLFLYLMPILILTATSLTGAELSVRLVAAQAEGEMDPKLRDVAKLLGQLPFQGLSVLKSETMELPAKGAVSLDNGLTIQLEGALDNLTVQGKLGDKRLLKTTIGLKLNRPFITVLPVSLDQQKLLLIIVAKEEQ